MVEAISRTAAQATTPARTTSLTANFDNFLKLLTTQLERQDPLSPMDATKFTSQLVEFTSVEQAIQTNTQLGELKELLQTSIAGAALGFIGHEVTAAADTLRLGGTGGATLSTDLKAASPIRLRVLDGTGRVVFESTSEGQAGRNSITWPGTTTTGSRAPEGAYRIELAALSAEGEATALAPVLQGRVSAVETVAGERFIRLGDTAVPMTSVSRVAAAAAPTA